MAVQGGGGPWLNRRAVGGRHQPSRGTRDRHRDRGRRGSLMGGPRAIVEGGAVESRTLTDAWAPQHSTGGG
jgi:hypothetical protein